MTLSRHTITAHGLIQTARGWCSDEAPHLQIDALLGRAVDVVKDMETENTRLTIAYDEALAEIARLRSWGMGWERRYALNPGEKP